MSLTPDTGATSGQPDEPVQLWRDLRIWIEDVAARIERDLVAGTGLTATEYQVLAVLAASSRHEVEQAELREKLHWSASRLSHQLRRMRARGLCDASELGHGTRMRVALTPAGETAFRAAHEVYENAVRDHLLDTISVAHRAEMQKAVRRGLSRMRDDR
jgi:DNA-binding MarR family transcriptional regulator